MLTLETSTQFRKDQKKALKQHKNFRTFQLVIQLLQNENTLPEKYCDHPLTGEWKGARDCHVEDDWVLIYQIDKKKKTLRLIRLGSHSELFR